MDRPESGIQPSTFFFLPSNNYTAQDSSVPAFHYFRKAAKVVTANHREKKVENIADSSFNISEALYVSSFCGRTN